VYLVKTNFFIFYRIYSAVSSASNMVSLW